MKFKVSSLSPFVRLPVAWVKWGKGDLRYHLKHWTLNFKLSLILPFLLSGCANIVSPTGGPKETEPPKVVQATPENLSKRFTGNKIALTFDELIQLDNPSQEIVVSPAIEPEPKINAKGKTLTIDFRESTLDSNTTYTINFGESLKDVHESTPLSGFSYVFSTGESLDSSFISGKVINARDDKPASKALVMLYKELIDSVVSVKKPFYFTKTGSDGSFRIDHVRKGTYKLFALQDENFNYLYDLSSEEIAFADAPIEAGDSSEPVHLLLFLEEKRGIPVLFSFDDIKPEYVKLCFSGAVDTLEVLSASDKLPVGLLEYNATRDTVMCWFTREVANDTLLVWVNEGRYDTIVGRNTPGSLDSLQQHSGKLSVNKSDSLIPPIGSITIALSRPVMFTDIEKLIITQDSPAVNIKPSLVRFINRRQIMLDFKRTPGLSYTILLPEGMLLDYFNTKNDTLALNLQANTAENYASLKLTAIGNAGNAYVLQLLDRSGKLIRQESFKEKGVLEFHLLPPGIYEALIVFDSNANGKWDTGNHLLHIQPEETYSHPEKINVRANWEMEVELNVR